jgi:uncharacterized membrane protein
MERLLQSGAEEAVVWTAVLAVMVVVAVYVIGKVRPRTVQQEPTAGQLLSKYHELHSRGVLTDAEFRTIKTTLASQLQRELKGNGETA